ACWYLAKELLPESEFPSDIEQVREENLIKPTRSQIIHQLELLSPCDDAAAWQDALHLCHCWLAKPASPPLRDLTFRIIGPEELPTVWRLAHEIWREAYPGIISVDQIHYMLERMYAPDELRQEMVVRGVVYALIEADGVPCGYLAWETVPNDRSLFLHKLYIQPRWHGCGLGAAALAWIEQLTQSAPRTAIRLRVNRQNHRAIRSYLRSGFRFTYDLCSDIGGGFVMDDHVMEKVL
ncbi:MAG: GNAT family N-acetyltransferase, partial [Roseimicrobium sp.]